MKPRWVLSLFVIISLTLPAQAAWAQRKGGPSEVDTREVKELASQGAQFFRDGEYEKALSSFEAAYDLDPVAGFLLNIGLCHLRLERPQKAAQSFRAFLEKAPPDDPLRPKVEEYLQEAEKKMAELGISPELASSPALSDPKDPEDPGAGGGSPLPKMLLGGAALFAVAGSAAGVVGFSSIVKARALEEEGQFSEMAEKFALGRKLGFAADALLVAGLISGGAGYLLGRRAKKTEKTEAALSLSPRGVALSIRF